MPNIHTCFWDELLKMGFHRIDGLHAVVDEEDLSAAFQLTQNGLTNQTRRIRSHMGDDRQAFFRRRIEVGDIPDAGQRGGLGATTDAGQREGLAAATAARRYCGSRSFSSVSTGLATKIDE